MRRLRFLGLIVFSASLQAQVRTWVSTTGLDANDCSRSSPCRNFAAAINAVNTGGEVVVLDSGGYGPVTITKDVALVSPQGIHAGIAPTSIDAIVINAPGANVRVRNLFLNAQGAGPSGIRILAGNSVLIEGCSARGFNHGISISPSVATLAPIIRDCTIHDSEEDGINILANLQPLAVLIENTLLANNESVGLRAVSLGATLRVVARNVTAVRNNDTQVNAGAFETGNTHVTLESCNLVGFFANSTGIFTDTIEPTDVVMVLVSNSTITGNSAGIRIFGPGSSVRGRGNNTVEGNFGLETFSSSFPGK